MEKANSVTDWLQFTGVTAADSETHTVPMLDVQMMVDHSEEGEKVRYTFYEKDSTSDKVLMFTSAMSSHTKITTLANEVIRRQRNVDRDWGPEHRAQILTTLMIKLARSGYPECVRQQVLTAGL